ncbi:MFS transporter [Neolewinella antarctica]|uniref:MFS family permease n=1 Tax=Neolewinella antarctica TaxID=442734 RepID=A0ABX0XEB0_9BACT|nr:MFS transporter [Neolewinella antarctica]NJC27656.1 MFS family permease [Neolewinella antarctica]
MTTTQLLRQHPRYLSYGFLHFFFSAVGQTFFISLFVDSISEGMGWEKGTFAGIYSSLTLVAAFTLPFIGAQVDKMRVRYVSTATILALAIGCSLVALSPTAYPLIFGLFICRLGGQGVLTLIGSTTIGRYFNEGRGKALSASIIGIPIAEVIIPIGAVYLLQTQGYSTVWLVAAGALLFVFLPAIWTLIRRYDNFQRADTVAEEQAGALEVGAEMQRSYKRGDVLRDRRFWLLLPAIVFTPFMFTGLMFNQSLIAEQRGYTAQWMALGISAYGTARVVCLLVAGEISDRMGPRRALRFVYFPAFAGLLCLWGMESDLAIPFFFALAGITAGIESVLWPALYAEWYGPRYLGSIKSMLKVVVVVASAVAPVVFSYGIQWDLDTTLLLLVGYAALLLALTQVQPGGEEPRL